MKDLLLTDRSLRVMSLAVREARRRGSNGIEPEHMLLGLVLEGTGPTHR